MRSPRGTRPCDRSRCSRRGNERCPTDRGDGNRPWVCTYVLALQAGTHTERGSVVTTGIYASPGDTDEFAVTRGAGAYENVRGFATLQEGPGWDDYTLHLIP